MALLEATVGIGKHARPSTFTDDAFASKFARAKQELRSTANETGGRGPIRR